MRQAEELRLTARETACRQKDGLLNFSIDIFSKSWRRVREEMRRETMRAPSVDAKQYSSTFNGNNLPGFGRFPHKSMRRSRQAVRAQNWQRRIIGSAARFANPAQSE
jgi:hypothetical protein